MDSENIDLRQKTILIVDDESDLREIVAGELEFLGAIVFQAENIQHAQDLLSKNLIDLVISDIRMPGGSGIELLEFVKKKFGANLPVILITGFADITPMDAYGKGAEALVSKPFQLDDFFKIVARHALRDNERLDEVIEAHKIVRSLDDKAIIGRGGVTFFVNMSERIDPGEGVRFDLHLYGHHLQGTGICRWIKSLGPGVAVIGLEFSSLDSDSWKNLPKLKRSDAYIPTATEL
jgi:CheY-like chemotaxis protein